MRFRYSESGIIRNLIDRIVNRYPCPTIPPLVPSRSHCLYRSCGGGCFPLPCRWGFLSGQFKNLFLFVSSSVSRFLDPRFFLSSRLPKILCMGFPGPATFGRRTCKETDRGSSLLPRAIIYVILYILYIGYVP